MTEMTPEWFAEEVDLELSELREKLIAKNREYGNSALNPIRIFSNASPVEQLLVRIDDKLSRLDKGNSDTEDTVFDLLGYLVLLRIAVKIP